MNVLLYNLVFSQPYLVRLLLCYSVASVCCLYGMYCR